MFRPQMVIIRPYNNMSQLVLYTYWDPIMFTLKCIIITEGSQNHLLRMC
jgi:hypothetical protein